jgi:endopeptidase La
MNPIIPTVERPIASVVRFQAAQRPQRPLFSGSLVQTHNKQLPAIQDISAQQVRQALIAKMGGNIRFGADDPPADPPADPTTDRPVEVATEMPDTPVSPSIMGREDYMFVAARLNARMQEMAILTSNAKQDAYLGYAPEAEPKHVIARAMAFAIMALDHPELLKKAPTDLNTQESVLRQSLDMILPPEVRKGKNYAQLKRVVNKSLQELNEIIYDPDRPVRQMQEDVNRIQLHDEVFYILKEFFLANKNPDKWSLFEFSKHMRDVVPTLVDISSDTVRTAEIMEKTIAAAKEVKVSSGTVKHLAESPEDFNELLEQHYNGGKGNMTEQQYEVIGRLIQKFATNNQGPEGAKYHERLNFLLEDYPWNTTGGTIDAKNTKRILDEDHWGLEKPKGKIIQHMAVLEDLKEKGLPPINGKILCLVGPPGVGKTSLAKSIARATGRNLAHVALGGVHEEAEIRGHRSTYIGALAGRVAKAFVEAGSQDPVLVLDELDKMSQGGHGGDPTAALLEVLDPNQNKRFKDHFVGDDIPLDLSKAIIMVTANFLEQIPGPLKDRLEIVQLEPYDEDEKVKITNKFLLPKIRKEYGLKDEEFRVPEKSVRTIINDYTFEAGVRGIDKMLRDLAEKSILSRRMGTGLITTMTGSRIVKLLEPPDTSISLLKGEVLKENTVGRSNGLVVMGDIGGKVGNFLATARTEDLKEPEMPGELVLTPVNKNLKDMTSDSVNNSLSWIQDHREQLGITVPKGKKIIVTVTTERGGPVDGDSAGAAITCAVVSALRKEPFRYDVAMTGTISTHGRVLAIGGLKHKLRGVLNAGEGVIKTVFVPKENEPDLKLLPKVLADKFATLDLTQKTGSPGEIKQIITAATEASASKGKTLVILNDRIEPILNYSLVRSAQPPAKKENPFTFSHGETADSAQMLAT